MTEGEWLDCSKPSRMLKFLRHKGTERRWRLFGCACCRRVWHLIPEQGRYAVEVSERFADNRATVDELRQSLDGIRYYQHQWYGNALDREHKQHFRAMQAATSTPTEASAVAAAAAAKLANPSSVEHKIQCNIIRDIFGNPFRSLPPRPEAIVALAEQIYAGQWELMPLLGEWLQEHGYWSEGEHCLDPNIHHVKGCWVVDWVTGRQ